MGVAYIRIVVFCGSYIIKVVVKVFNLFSGSEFLKMRVTSEHWHEFLNIAERNPGLITNKAAKKFKCAGTEISLLTISITGRILFSTY